MDQGSERYNDRDLSWLSFNYRVLQEAADPNVPLYERIRFLAIFSSNLEEFFRVRVGNLRRLMRLSKKKLKKLELEPHTLHQRILSEVRRQQREFGHIFREELIPALESKGILIVKDTELNEEQQAFLDEFFELHLKFHLRPIFLDERKMTPFLKDRAIYFVLELAQRKSKNKEIQPAMLMIPTDVLPRFVELPSPPGHFQYIFLDDIIRYKFADIFPGFKVKNAHSIKMSRDADLQIDDEYSGDLVEKIKRALAKRDSGIPARFLFDETISPEFLEKIKTFFRFGEADMVPGGRYHNFFNFFDFPNPYSPDLEYANLPALLANEFDGDDSMFHHIRERDHVIHFPYQTYDYVIRFLNEAAISSRVKSIKVTQYRVAQNSAVVNALIMAARNGKQVTVFVELKARFDEALNLHWAREMEKSGVKIIYSIPGLKVHAKVALVERLEEGVMNTYAFLSTGNYNEKTARIYCDHGLFTIDKRITGEIAKVFDYLENRTEGIQFQHLLVAQFGLLDRFSAMIDDIIQAKGERYILIKLNGLEDTSIIEKLYEASQAGVKVDMIVRGICCIKPGVPGMSENIRVIRLVDRFLEHARIFYFKAEGIDNLFMGSADWMARNLHRRIEVVFPVFDPRIKKQVLDICDFQLRDNTKARQLDSSLQPMPISEESRIKINAQLATYAYVKAIQEKILVDNKDVGVDQSKIRTE